MKKNILHFLMLTTITAVNIQIINHSINISAASKKLLKRNSGTYYHWKYGEIFYKKMGKGSPILLIHDLDPASSSIEWEKVEKHLSKTHTVYTLDLLGCGLSSRPTLTYTNYLFVQLLNDFIKDVVKNPADLICTGKSCSFSLMACNMNPENINHIILIHPENQKNLEKTPGKGRNILKVLLDTPILGTFIYNIIYSHEGIHKSFSKNYSKLSANRMDYYYESAHIDYSKGKHLFSSIYSNYTNIPISHALKNITNPIFIISGKENEIATQIAQSYMKQNPKIETAYIPHSKYCPQLENPEKFLETVHLFL